ncbi:MAG: FxsA family protein [Thermoguttaceae bacterium]|nr:FxsA family protein [Thermoguttaceae bacterium]
MPLPFLIFVALPCLELLTFVFLGEAFGYERIFALIAIMSLTGIILFRLVPRPFGYRPGETVPPLDGILYRFGAILLIVPGLITGFAGIPLLFRSGRALYLRWFGRKYCPNGPADLPMPLRLLALFFGVNSFEPPRQASSGGGRAWNPYGANETDEEAVVEDEDPDAASAYNGDLSPDAASKTDDEIIDVDYTVR